MTPPTGDITASEPVQLPWESIDPPAEISAGGAARPDPGPRPFFIGSPAQLGVQPAPALSPVTDRTAPGVPAAPIAAPAPSGGGGWTIPLLSAGLALVAACVILPQIDANRRLDYERQTLQMDLDSIDKQVAVNDEFLKRVADDPTLAERLAQRQMKIIRSGSRVLSLKGDAAGEMSPFRIVKVSPPPPLPPYQPSGGILARLCCAGRSRLYVTGIALTMIAAGLVLGSSTVKD